MNTMVQMCWPAAEQSQCRQKQAERATMIDLFCGSGGLSLGMEQAGFEPIFAIDMDEVAIETYRSNRDIDPHIAVAADIRDINAGLIEKAVISADVDLVCGGPPCQGFSMANRQRLVDDPRNMLYKEYLRFLSRVQPRFFVMENVRGMRARLPEILEDMRNYLGASYDVASTVLNAKDFGVPQNRERFIVLGNRVGISSTGLLLEIASSAQLLPEFTLRDAIGDLPELAPNRAKNRNDIENSSIGFRSVEFEYKSTAFRSYINSGRDIHVLSNHKNRYNNDRDIEIYSRLPQGANSLHPSIADIMPYARRKGIFKDKYYKLQYDAACKTITSHMARDCNMYIHPTQARGLSAREAARVQTFPDDYVFFGPQNSWYRQIGNAVPVKLAEAIGRCIRSYV